MMKNTLLTLFAAGAVAQTASAALTWTGAGDGVSAFQEANWLDDNNAVPAGGTVDNGPGGLTAATGGVIDITGGTGSPGNWGGSFDINGNTMNVSGKAIGGGGLTGSDATLNLTAGATSANFGISGMNQITVNASSIDMVGTTGISFSGSNPLMSVLNGSFVSTQFISADSALDNLALTLGGSSTLQFLGGGNPVNTMTIDVLDAGSIIQFDAETFAAFQSEHESKVTYQGQALVYGVNVIADDTYNGGNGVQLTFIPEPSSSALLGLVGLGFILRRRK